MTAKRLWTLIAMAVVPLALVLLGGVTSVETGFKGNPLTDKVQTIACEGGAMMGDRKPGER